MGNACGGKDKEAGFTTANHAAPCLPHSNVAGCEVLMKLQVEKEGQEGQKGVHIGSEVMVSR
jgi:hypothetical protein